MENLKFFTRVAGEFLNRKSFREQLLAVLGLIGENFGVTRA